MTPDAWILVALLSGAVLLFVTEWLRVDVVALMMLVALALTGLVTPEEALAGFSNPAVVTVWAVFILSGGLTRTGVANMLGQLVLRLAGRGERRLIVLIMAVAALLSAFMNNVGVAALLLPVVMDITRRTGRSPARLLMPLAYACLLGGSLTLIGTPPNLLANQVLLDAGLPGFRLFDFTLPGLAITSAGILFVVLFGGRLVPDRGGAPARGADDLARFYGLEERLQRVRVPVGSPLVGRTLGDSQIRATLELTVVGIWRDGRNLLAPDAQSVIEAGDELLVSGPRRHLRAFLSPDYLRLGGEVVGQDAIAGLTERLARVRLTPGSDLVGRTVAEAGVRDRLGLNVLELRRDGAPVEGRVAITPLRAGDELIVHGPDSGLEMLEGAGCEPVASGDAVGYPLERHLLMGVVPAASPLVGQTLRESRLGDALAFAVLALERDGRLELDPASDRPLAGGDRLIMGVGPEGLTALAAAQSLSPVAAERLGLPAVQSDAVGLMEVTLSPLSQLAGRTLRQIEFRAKYDLSVLSIWRAGRAYQEDLPDMPLRFGDALLVYGRRAQLQLLGREPDFLVLTEDAQEPLRRSRAPLAAGLMIAVVFVVFFELMPLSVAALAAGVLMVLTGCLTMEEAYRFIDWKAVFLIAGMVPLGTALQGTGLAQLVAAGLVGPFGALGPLALLFGFFLLSALASLFLPNAVAALIVGPIALDAALRLGVSPYAVLIVVAVSSSCSFLTPVGHPANVLVMGPGGYRFTDYLRLGLPLLVVVMLSLLLAVSWLWPA